MNLTKNDAEKERKKTKKQKDSNRKRKKKGRMSGTVSLFSLIK
jgi:hypothetical protein